MKNILIAGGTGLVGRHLSAFFLQKGYQVAILTRNQHLVSQANHVSPLSYFHWDTDRKYIDPKAIQFANIIVNLAGENVAQKRWTKKQKHKIEHSRVSSGKMLADALKKNKHSVSYFIQASAIGWYGDGNLDFKESAKNSDDFLGVACKKWEESIDYIKENKSIKLSIIRIGIVLANDGGFFLVFNKMVYKSPIMAVFAKGKQYVSWIHVEDLCRMIHFCITNTLEGIFNAVSPNPFTNKEFMTLLINRSKRYRIMINLPEYILKIFLGEMSIEILKSVTVSSDKIQSEGFDFKYPDIHSATSHLLNMNND